MGVTIAAIAAMDEERAIGKGGTLPWHLPEDMRRFSKLTKGHAVLMGRKTYESLPEKFRPLPDRMNFVVTHGAEPKGAFKVGDLPRFLESVASGEEKLPVQYLWVIGGGTIYEQSLPYCSCLEITRVKGTHSGDVFFPKFEDGFSLVGSEEGERCVFERWTRT